VVNGAWWITGGDFDAIDNSEILLPFSSTFIADEDLPASFNSHCQVTIDDDTVFLSAEDRLAYLYDFPSKTFTRLRNLDISRESGACGVVRSDRGTEIVVVSDYSSR